MTVIYYRWAYSPTTGDVTLAHNHEGHPADLMLHDDMREARPESDLIVGYAYRAEDHWKITDEDNKPIDDPHVIASVEKEIVDYERR